ncbi:O-antigen ligase family protein [candidate division KSB1 bacterium]|nr:O-antigen ligase family protein [candidate division KSB1 bacterium]
MSRLIFFAIAWAAVIAALVIGKNKKRLMLSFLVLYFPFEIGIIFFISHGFMLTDLPLFILVFIGLFDKSRFRFVKEAVPILILVFAGLLSSTYAQNSNWAISEALRYARGLLIFLVIVNEVKDPKDLRTVINCLFIGLFFQSLVAIYQWRFGAVGLQFLGERHYGGWRTRGTFGHESIFGNYLIFLIPLIFRLFVYYRHPIKAHNIRHAVLLLCGAMALFTSFTRGPWVGFTLSVTVMVFYSLHAKKLRPKFYVPFAIMLIGASVFFVRYLPKIIGQFQGDRMESADIRMPLNRVALRVISANPIFGVGLGNYKETVKHYVVPEDEPDLESHQIEQLRWDYVHNSFLLVTAESGVIGGSMFVMIFLIAFIKGKKVLKESKSEYLTNLTIGILTGLGAVFFAFQLSPDIHIHQINVLLFIMTSLIIAIGNIQVKLQRQHKMKAYRIHKERVRYENIRNI